MSNEFKFQEDLTPWVWHDAREWKPIISDHEKGYTVSVLVWQRNKMLDHVVAAFDLLHEDWYMPLAPSSKAFEPAPTKWCYIGFPSGFEEEECEGEHARYIRLYGSKPPKDKPNYNWEFQL